MRKKLVSLLLALIMALSLLPAGVLAEADHWTALQNAVTEGKVEGEHPFSAKAEDGTITITLTDDVTCEKVQPLTVASGKKVVLDLGGKTLTAACEGDFLITVAGELTVKNGTLVANGNGILANGKLTIDKDAVIKAGTDKNSIAVKAAGKAEQSAVVTVNSGAKIEMTKGTAIVTEGTAKATALIVNGGDISSEYGISVSGGTVAINNCSVSTVYWALNVQNGGEVKLTVLDGSFKSEKLTDEIGCVINGGTKPLEDYVCGGTFYVTDTIDGGDKNALEAVMNTIVDMKNFGWKYDKTSKSYTVWPRNTKPVAGEGYEINFEDGNVYALLGYEISDDGGEHYHNSTRALVTNTMAYQIRKEASPLTCESESVTFRIYDTCMVNEPLLGMSKGVRLLYLNGQNVAYGDTTAYRFGYDVLRDAWTIRQYNKTTNTDGKYLSTQNGTNIEFVNEPFYWSYDGVGFCVDIKDNPLISARKLITRLFDSIFSFITTGGLSTIKVGTYYLAANVNTAGNVVGLQGVEGVPVLAQQYHAVGYEKHLETCEAVNETHHTEICGRCGVRLSDDKVVSCTFGDSHVCVCGNVEPGYLPEIEVTKDSVRSLFNWRQRYTVTIDTNGLAGLVEYSVDGGNDYWPGTKFNTTTSPSSFRFRITGSAYVYDFIADHTVVKLDKVTAVSG